MRWAAVWLVATSLACGSPALPTETPPSVEEEERAAAHLIAPPSDTRIPGRRPNIREQHAIQRLLHIAERTRGLSFRESVPFRIQSREVITDFVRRRTTEENEEVEQTRQLYVALGLLAPDIAVEDLVVRVLGEQIVGYYDPDQGVMVIREDIAAGLDREGALDESEMIIVHELVHALQDQALGLGHHYADERDVDAANAFASLIEGDATLAMMGHMASARGASLDLLTQNLNVFERFVRRSNLGDTNSELGRAPAIVREPLISRYVDGMLFCAALYQREGWSGVNTAHQRPPISTEQVLHPARYARDENPATVSLPETPDLEAMGWEAVLEDTLGELELSIYFATALERTEAQRAAEGWNGDRLRLYAHPDGSLGILWWTLWDTEPDAQEAEEAANAVVAGRPTSEGFLVRRSQSSVVIVRHLPLNAVESLLSPFSPPNTASDGSRQPLDG